jgi:hypothetical protein
VAPELDPETDVGRAPADHAIGVDPVHRCIAEAAGPAECGAEEAVLAVVANAGGGYILSMKASSCPLQPDGVHQSILAVEHAAYLGGERGVGEWLHDEIDAGVEPSLMDDGVSGAV